MSHVDQMVKRKDQMVKRKASFTMCDSAQDQPRAVRLLVLSALSAQP